MKLRLALLAWGFLAAAGAFAAATNDLSDVEIQGRRLAEKILQQRPAESFTNIGVLKIRDGKGRHSEISVKCEIIVTATNWWSIYDAQVDATNWVLLTIVHRGETPSGYRLGKAKAANDVVKATVLEDDQTITPFAGSDFWVADLGLEFFHWPEQKVLKHEMRRGRACKVLESTNPNPSTNGYSRVVSWIDNETLGMVHAEACDSNGGLLKEFDPQSFKKVDGQWELQDMEIRNVQSGSRTRLEFDLKTH